LPIVSFALAKGSGRSRLLQFITLDTLRLEVMTVPTKNPRVNVVLEQPLYDLVLSWARRDGISLSLKVRDVVKAAVEAEEDAVLAECAEKRERTFSRRKALTHAKVWEHLARKRR
jgi:hypothetical protein